jgi:hypothetical protein
MPLMTLTASVISLDSEDLSDKCNSVELTADVDEKEVTTFGDLGWKAVKGGLKSGSLKLKFFNDLADGEIDELMWANLGEVVAFAVKADPGAISASNPEYQGLVLIKQWTPVSGGPGDVNSSDVTFPTSGAITRDVTA